MAAGVPSGEVSAYSISPSLMPGRIAAASGRVMVAEIMARTAPWYLSTPRSRYSAA